MLRILERTTILGLLAFCLSIATAGCEIGAEVYNEEDQGYASVRISLGRVAGSSSDGEGDISPMDIPAQIAYVDLWVTGPDMADFYQRYEVPPTPGSEMTIDLSLPPGPDRVFVVDALDAQLLAWYTGGAEADLVLEQTNTVVIQMQGLGYINGRILFMMIDDPFLPDPEAPLSDYSELSNGLLIETDADGYYALDRLAMGTYRIEVNPAERTFGFGEVTLAEPGEQAELNIVLIQPDGFYPFVSSLYPHVTAIGEVVTFYGSDFMVTAYDPSAIFNLDLEMFEAFPIEFSDEHLTVQVPPEALLGEHWAGVLIFTGEVFRGSNPVHINVLP